MFTKNTDTFTCFNFGCDRVLAIRLGIFAVDLLCKGETGKCVGVFGEQLKATNIFEANRLPKKQAQEIKPCVQKI